MPTRPRTSSKKQKTHVETKRTNATSTSANIDVDIDADGDIDVEADGDLDNDANAVDINGPKGSKAKDVQEEEDEDEKRDYNLQQYWEQRYVKYFNNLNNNSSKNESNESNVQETYKKTSKKRTKQQQKEMNKKSTDDEDDITTEWYYQFEDILPLLLSSNSSKSASDSIVLNSPVLDVGIGLSSTFQSMRAAHFSGSFIGIDYCPSVIEYWTKHSKSHPAEHPTNVDVQYKLLDASMCYPKPFERHSFGLVLDKATSDGLMCSDANVPTVAKMYTCISSILKPGGVFVIATVQEPEDSWSTEILIPSLLEGDAEYNWRIVVHTLESENRDGELGGPNVFVCQKNIRSARNRTSKIADSFTIVRKYH